MSSFNSTPPYKQKPLKDSVIVLGQGYINDKQQASTWDCFRGNITSAGGGSSIINFDNAVSFSEIQETFQIDITAKVGIGPFSASEKATYLRAIQEDHYSQSFYYYAKVTLPTQVWHPGGYGIEMLNDVGKGIYQSGAIAFRLNCGDAVINQVQEGASLYAAMKISFSSYTDKQTFQAQAGGSFGSIVDVSVSIQDIVNQYKLNGDVEVTAYQQGGDPSQLPKVFEKGEGGYYVTSCTLADLADCKNTINGILDYAVNNFPTQLNGTTGELLNYVMGSLEYMGLTIGNSTITPAIETARETLGETYFNQIAQSIFINHLLESSFMSAQYIEAYILNELQNQYKNLQNNIVVLQDPNVGVVQCYNNPPNCADVEQNIQQLSNPINSSFINEFVSSYSYFIIRNDNSQNSGVFYPVGNGLHKRFSDSWCPIPQETVVRFNETGEQLDYFEYDPQHGWSFNCGPAQELLPDFPDKYMASYAPGNPYYNECFLQYNGPKSAVSGNVTYDIIDNPL